MTDKLAALLKELRSEADKAPKAQRQRAAGILYAINRISVTVGEDAEEMRKRGERIVADAKQAGADDAVRRFVEGLTPDEMAHMLTRLQEERDDLACSLAKSVHDSYEALRLSKRADDENDALRRQLKEAQKRRDQLDEECERWHTIADEQHTELYKLRRRQLEQPAVTEAMRRALAELRYALMEWKGTQPHWETGEDMCHTLDFIKRLDVHVAAMAHAADALDAALAARPAPKEKDV